MRRAVTRPRWTRWNVAARLPKGKAEPLLSDHLAQSVAASHTSPQLDTLSRAVTVANASDRLSDADAIDLHDAIAARRRELAAPSSARRSGVKAPPTPCSIHPAGPAASSPRSPDRAASIARRRQRATEGWMRPEDARHFTEGERAVLAVVALEVRTKGLCALPIDAIGAFAGACRTLAKRALRLAATLGLLSVTERRVARDRNDTNVVRIVAGGWLRWLRQRGVGSRKGPRPDTQSLQGDRTTRPATAPRREGGAAARSDLERAGGPIRARPGPLPSRWSRLRTGRP